MSLFLFLFWKNERKVDDFSSCYIYTYMYGRIRVWSMPRVMFRGGTPAPLRVHHIHKHLFAQDLGKSVKVFPFRHLVYRHFSRRTPSVWSITERREKLGYHLFSLTYPASKMREKPLHFGYLWFGLASSRDSHDLKRHMVLNINCMFICQILPESKGCYHFAGRDRDFPVVEVNCPDHRWQWGGSPPGLLIQRSAIRRLQNWENPYLRVEFLWLCHREGRLYREGRLVDT